jgi:hypothetical protein
MWAHTSTIARGAIEQLVAGIQPTFPQQEDHADNQQCSEYLLFFVEGSAFVAQTSRRMWRFGTWSTDRCANTFCRVLGKSNELLEAILLPQAMQDISQVFAKIGTAPKSLYLKDDNATAVNMFSQLEEQTESIDETAPPAVIENAPVEAVPALPPAANDISPQDAVDKFHLFQQYAKQMDWKVALEIANPLFAYTMFLFMMSDKSKSNFQQKPAGNCDEAISETLQFWSRKYRLEFVLSENHLLEHFFGNHSCGGKDTMNMNLQETKKPLITLYRGMVGGLNCSRLLEILQHQLNINHSYGLRRELLTSKVMKRL